MTFACRLYAGENQGEPPRTRNPKGCLPAKAGAEESKAGRLRRSLRDETGEAGTEGSWLVLIISLLWSWGFYISRSTLPLERG